MPRVSVILSSYNHGKFIAEAIQSVLDQTFTDFELFVIDDCSEDNSWEIIQRFEDPRIVATRNPKRMRGAYGFNETIRHRASGEFIAIHHSDDAWLPEKLEKQVAFLDGHADVGAAFTRVYLIDESGAPFTEQTHFYYSVFNQSNRDRFEWLRHFFLEGNCLCHPSVLARKEAMLSTGLYDRRLGQITDFDLWVRFCLRNDIYILDDELTRFRIRDNEANQSGDSLASRVRGSNEWPLVFGHLLQLRDEESFFSVFPEMRRLALATGNNMTYLLAMCAIETNCDYRMHFGLGLLYELLAEEKVAAEINVKYGFGYIDLIELSARAVPYYISEMDKMQEGMRGLKREIVRMRSTFSWRVTKPLRFLAFLWRMLAHVKRLQ